MKIRVTLLVIAMLWIAWVYASINALVEYRQNRNLKEYTLTVKAIEKQIPYLRQLAGWDK